MTENYKKTQYFTDLPPLVLLLTPAAALAAAMPFLVFCYYVALKPKDIKGKIYRTEYDNVYRIECKHDKTYYMDLKHGIAPQRVYSKKAYKPLTTMHDGDLVRLRMHVRDGKMVVLGSGYVTRWGDYKYGTVHRVRNLSARKR